MIEITELLPATSSGLRAPAREILAPPVCSILPAGTGLLSCELLLTADGSDRLELSFSADEVRGGPQAALEACGAGVELTLGHPCGALFRGSIQANGLKWDSGGTALFLTAGADHHHSGEFPDPQTYYQHSDSELAEAIASELGLRALVEPTEEVFERVVRRGDRLDFLRERARKIGFELALLPGELFFSSKLPRCAELSGLPAARGVLSRDESLLEFSFRELSGLGRGGDFEVRGDPGWRPLQELDIAGMGDPFDGRYRVARARHHWDELGYRTRVDYLETGVDLELWSEE
ncbi:MAG: hypothetical protein VX387_00125 [Planctomycetota bacterium]|nr:hypothetical protein [Planctomycetota bacterium]